MSASNDYRLIHRAISQYCDGLSTRLISISLSEKRSLKCRRRGAPPSTCLELPERRPAALRLNLSIGHSKQKAQLSLTNRAMLVCKVVEVWHDFLSEYVDKKFTYICYRRLMNESIMAEKIV